MTAADINLLLLGGVAMGSFIAGLIFLRLWRDGGDRLFLFFALSFGVQAVNRIALVLTEQPDESRPWHYTVRLISYLLIIWAIIDKNRALPDRPPEADPG